MFGIDAGVQNLGTDFFGRRQRKWDKEDRDDSRRYDRDRFVRLSADAKKAGIHPLFAMGAGTTSPAIVSKSAIAPRGARSDIGSSIQSMVNRSTRAKQNELLDGQIQSQKLENKLLQQEIDMGQTTTSVNQDKPRPAPVIAGKKINKHKGWSDAQTIEDRYGDIVSWAYGLGVVGADLTQAIQDRYKLKGSHLKKIVNEVKALYKKYSTHPKSFKRDMGNYGYGKFY